jgi:hypothetical protein
MTSGSWVRIRNVVAWIKTNQRITIVPPLFVNPCAGSKLHLVVESKFVMERLTIDLENALDSNHQIKYSLIIHPLLHLVVESRVVIVVGTAYY